jgi:hypothetical protein
MWPKKPEEKAEDFAYADDPTFSRVSYHPSRTSEHSSEGRRKDVKVFECSDECAIAVPGLFESVGFPAGSE